MKYPKWAPATLIAEYERQIDQIASLEQFIQEEEMRISAISDEEWQNNIRTTQDYLNEARSLRGTEKQKLGYYERLVTDERAREIWNTLARHPDANEPPPDNEDDRPYAYAHYCWHIRESAEKIPSHTHSDKRENLLTIAKKAKELQNLCCRSPYFSNRWFIAEQMTRESINDRYFGTKYSAAMQEWSLERLKRSQQVPQISFDSHWLLGLYNNVTLEQILGWLADDATGQAEIAPIVKKAKGKNRQRNYFIRTLHSFHVHRFGQPLWDMMAASANVMFDLSATDALSADDIRPLIN